ncbi:hybrid sensor histidine kinase/response regulator [Marinomonas posidonica]|uniref:histidine kinase n=1 Tax=Marinomonas posidonica (strain CECT 7376 / NCIMB 14433 / IVIA-Po-181) TaxID=491952 RepID=F6CSK6_MARPP|nr:ATP-binding protein [Marinomonas posidonica]AEF56164.1 integral membrane sensor hybrid histidine kinase [Marinomonas posidonica IVIA-Po-181]
MTATQKIFKVRRHYNKWVADQTLEDYALRYTSKQGRTMSIERVGHTALGAAAFLALEGLAAVITLSYGFTNAVAAILVVLAVFFVTGFPIAYYSAKHGLDIDLLTRGAGFGYLGSTITSLIYATFTFIFFAIEAAILASALEVLLGIPLPLGYALSSLFVIPIVTHGIRAISRFQNGTQWIWLVLQVAAIGVVVSQEYQNFGGWTEYVPQHLPETTEFDWILFGAAASVLFALMAQIGEQVDYLRFFPKKNQENKKRWWFWLVLAGPGWVFIGAIKMLLGSFLAYLAISDGATAVQATDPTFLYQQIFLFLTTSPTTALILAAVFVFICQMKINLTNAYAGSIAWSNFFSRLTHSHPGRVVWLVFNVTIALLLMELGIYQALGAILSVFAISAVSWLSSLSADLLINKPLGLSPKDLEFKRAHLYDINPVGTGSMLVATSLGLMSYLGLFGEVAKSLSHFISIATCFVCVPFIAWITKGKYYIARQSPELVPLINVAQKRHAMVILTCGICENAFETEDMSFCSAYQLPICSLCCSLDVRCLDSCKPNASISKQSAYFLKLFLPKRLVKTISSRLGRFASLLLVINIINGALMMLIYRQMSPSNQSEAILLQETMWALFFTLLIVSGVLSWLFLLAHESRVVAQKESNRQTRKLTREIEAHQVTDQALQGAKEQAEQANEAKSRYLSGISHELRTPLQSIIGYAQLLSEKPDTPSGHQNGLDIIHRSGLYLADLIEGLLDISKIEAGRFDLYRNTVDLPKLIDQLNSMFAMQSRAKGIQFQSKILAPLPKHVVTDEKRLRQILINLLSNAVKYTPQGNVQFEVNYRNQVAEFVIRDSGLGIKPEHLQRVFDPFERVRDLSTANLPGTGLGLTIVKLLTEIMGGDLQAQSSLGEGSEFKVSLMLPWVSDGEHVSQITRRIVGYRGFQRSIMLVDDDPIVRGLLSDILAPLGFHVIESPDAESCLEALPSRSPDLFILDVSMPGMNGLTLAKCLRNQEYSAPIVMLSADVQESQRQPDEQKAFNQYLVKPVKNGDLLEAVQHWLAVEWIYQDTNDTTVFSDRQIEQSVDEATEGRLIPDHESIRELIAFAEMGYKKGVRECLNKVTADDMLGAQDLDQLEALYQAFQFDGIAQYLQQRSM